MTRIYSVTQFVNTHIPGSAQLIQIDIAHYNSVTHSDLIKMRNNSEESVRTNYCQIRH